ncbi:MAG: hypothetical protein IPJ65_03100 [Archangiaceae bacterium]|nr:hypothetical protein [Archangiaceae bacterium]
MSCQVCGRQVPTARVTLMQNIGMLVARQSKTLQGDVCRPCGLRAFKSMTLTTLFLGWWGVISLVLTPVFLIGNLVAWSSLRALPASDESNIQSG